MKFTVLLLLITCLGLSARTTAQVSITEKGSSLEKVLQTIKKQSGYNLIYSNTLVQQKGKPVDIDVKNVPVNEALKLVFQNQVLTYELAGTTILIKEKKETAVLNPVVSSGDNGPLPADITVSGKVTDEDGKPLQGASVKVKGAKAGTTTNSEGFFTLTNVPENAILRIEFVGFETREMKAAPSGSMMGISMTKRVNELDEVIVGKGYYEEKQRLTVGNAVRVTAKDIDKQPVQNVLNALQGRVPGLYITQTSGITGSAVNVIIQGPNSIANSTVPLYIVDGVTFDNTMPLNGITNGSNVLGGGNGSPLSFIDINDIESIDILKDADATAIYGSRAANGAIIITTKRGKPGRTKFSLNINKSVGHVTNLTPVLNRRQYLDMRYEAFRNDGLIPSNNPNATGVYKYAPDLTIFDTTRETNWQKEFLSGTADIINIHAGISGGTSAVNYLLSGTYGSSTTVFSDQLADRRGGIQFGLNSSISQKFKLSFKASYLYDKNVLPNADLTGYANSLVPVAPALYNSDGTVNWAIGPSGTSLWQSTHPLHSTLFVNYEATTSNLVGSLEVSYQLLKGLEFKTLIGYNLMNQTDYSGITPAISIEPAYQSLVVRKAGYGLASANSWNVEPQLAYSGNLWKGKVTGLFGATLLERENSFTKIEGSGHSSDLLLRTVSSATTITADNGGVEYRYSGLMARINYNIDDQYIVSMNGRRDGSSRFGADNRYTNFGSVGAAWIFSQNKYFRNYRKVISFGKLRFSYGTTGSDGISDYAYLSLYSNSVPSLPYQNTSGLRAGAPANPGLQWEQTNKLLAGIDLSFINDRVRFNFSYARNRSSNQLISIPVPITTGSTTFRDNYPATIQNTSLEFALGTTNIKSRIFEWSTDFNLTIGRNKLIAFPDLEKTSYAGGLAIGQPINRSYIFRGAGVDPGTGLYQFFDSKGNIVTNVSVATDRFFVDQFPKFIGGFENRIKYKSLQIDFHFFFMSSMKIGNVFYNPLGIPPGAMGGLGATGNQYTAILDRWVNPGDHASIQKISTSISGVVGTQSQRIAISDYSFKDASYLRLRNVSISWTVPQNITGKIGLRSLQLFCQGQNLLTFSSYLGHDPESTPGSLPPLRVFNFGIQAGL